MDITKLSGPKLHALIAKRQAARDTALDATIAAGMGMMKHMDIVALSTAGNEIAIEYLLTRTELMNVLDELYNRKRYHGGDKPIKQKVW
jgi:hypothetical protein